MERDVALSALKTALTDGTLPSKDRGFAESLVSQGEKRGLSEKQWYWVTKLVSGLLREAPAPVADFKAVYAMFRKAQAHLKHPKIVLTTPTLRLKLYVSTARSRVPDVVNVVDTESDTWYGRVFEDGRWEGGMSGESKSVEALLIDLAKDPEGVAARHGRLTGCCCFCNRKLEDARSTDVGYGPVCASRFGLTWGKKR